MPGAAFAYNWTFRRSRNGQIRGASVTSILDQEIREQPDALSRLLKEGRVQAEAIAAAIHAYQPRFVVIAARGSSDNAARYAEYVLGAHNRLTAALATPSLFTRYEATPSLAGALVIGVSQSGQSPDVVAVLEAARKQNAVTVSITQDPKSPLAQMADHVFPLAAGEERAIAATKTYTNQLMAFAMLSAALDKTHAAERWDELERVPAQVAEAIRQNDSPGPLVEPFKGAWRIVVVGRGFNYSTACEVALKVKETSYAMAEPYSPPDLLHGPIAMLDEKLPVFLVAPSSMVDDDLDKILQLGRERKAGIIAVSDREDVLAGASAALRMPGGVPEWLSPIVAVVPGQLWAQAFALVRGVRPDAPRGLSKVTRTH
jgi:glucosamine--fructose-6-phosphate aminotransferase (isomerizing)